MRVHHQEMPPGRSAREGSRRRTSHTPSVVLGEWFLSAAERDNPDSLLHSRHPDPQSWTTGNDVRPLVHGVASVSYTHLRAHETRHDLVCRLLLEKKKHRDTT